MVATNVALDNQSPIQACPWLEQGAVTSWCGWVAGLQWYRPEAARSRLGRLARSSASSSCVRKMCGRRQHEGKKLSATLAYPALFEPEPEGGFTVTFPEAGIAATYRPNRAAARAQAEDMLEEMITHGEEVPWPASVPKGRRLRPSIPLPAPTAAKLEIYRAMRAEGSGTQQLAQRLGWEPAQVTRLFGRRATRLDHIERHCERSGARLSSPARRLKGWPEMNPQSQGYLSCMDLSPDARTRMAWTVMYPVC